MLVPRSYQEKGIEFLRAKKRGACDDAVGLGKTLTGLLAADTPTLVACPKYLIPQWVDNIKKQFPMQTVVGCTGATHERAFKLTLQADWHVINIEMFRNHKFPIKYNTLLIDEAHRLRGRTALQSKNAVKLARTIPRHIQLTATPMIKGVEDFFMQLQLIDPKRFSSYNKYLDEWCLYHEDQYGLKIIGPRNPEKFRAMLSEYIIRRSYEDVEQEVPELLESVCVIQGDEHWKKLYKNCKDNYTLTDIYFANGSQVYSALRQVIACKQKLEFLQELVEDFPIGTKVLIFTDRRDSAELVGKFLNIPYIHGAMNALERAPLAKASQSVVATIGSLSEGVDLSSKDAMIFFEEVHTPGKMDQARGRVQRARANMNPIPCYYLHMANSLDVRIHAAQISGNVPIESILKEEING